MLAIGLALVSALSAGISDFVGGVLSKTRSSWMVAMLSQLVAAAVTAIIALLLSGRPTAVDFAWAAAGGVGEALGIASLYYGLAHGRMAVVAPISGTGAALVPVAVGVATGDQPSWLAWIGIALAFPAVYLIPRSPKMSASPNAPANNRSSVTIGALAGLGFGSGFACIGQIDRAAGVLPLALLWLISALTVALVALLRHEPWVPQRGDGPAAVVAFGPIGAVALLTFLLATGHGLLAVISVIAALYPAITVIMAALILRERIGTLQSLGLTLAVITVVLVTIGH